MSQSRSVSTTYLHNKEFKCSVVQVELTGPKHRNLEEQNINTTLENAAVHHLP